MMKAIVYREFGSADNLMLEEVPIPTLKTDKVLIKVIASSINSWDGDLVKGSPFYARLVGGGFFKPKIQVLGIDVAGVIEKVGDEVTDFQVGDRVFGDLSEDGFGCFAELVVTRSKNLAKIPDNLDFSEVVTLPHSGVLALQTIRKFGKIKSGQTALVNGAGGGVGPFAIQMLKENGAVVTGVDKSLKKELIQEVGADHFLDYNEVDFTKTREKYDFILDNIATHKAKDYARTLTRDGHYEMTGGWASSILSALIFGRRYKPKSIGILAHKPNREDLELLTGRVSRGELKSTIDSEVPLNELPSAMKRFLKGDVLGKVIVRIPG